MVRRGCSFCGSLSCRGSACPLDLRPREWIVGVRAQTDGSMVRLKPLSIVTNCVVGMGGLTNVATPAELSRLAELGFDVYSTLSFAFAADFVCHCMLSDESVPPRLSGRT